MTFSVIDTATGIYPDLEKIALTEEWAKGLCYCDMEGFAVEEDGTLILLDECCKLAYPPEGRFEIVPYVVTNGDRIMTDEELAECLNNKNFCSHNFDCEKGKAPCLQCNLDWLKEEVKDG